MKQKLWILNSSLLAIFLMVLLINNFLEQEPPKIRINPKPTGEVQKKKPVVLNIERIYKLDIFGTFSDSISPVAQQSFVTPIPEPQKPTIIPPPEPKKQEFIAPLNISLKGIIYSSQETNSVAMFEDETKKEHIYHSGDKIKDGQVLRVGRNKVIVLRSNGQEEIFLLRKDDLVLGEQSQQPQKPDEKWKYTIKKIDDKNYELDIKQFAKNTPSLAKFMENLNIATAYQDGQTVGIKIGAIEPDEVGTVMGLKPSDIITSINNVDTKSLKNRIKIYDAITRTKKKDIIKVALKRDSQDLMLNYKISKLEPKKASFLQSTKEGAQTSGMFKLSPEQEREKRLQEFKKYHRSPRQQQAISDVRQRFLDNLRSRTRNRRVR